MAIGVYIHIPFCVAKCNYCDFNSYVMSDEIKKSYVDAICNEILNCNLREAVDTIYFGGGTPTILNADWLVKILDTVKNKFNILEDCEITTECNPKTADKEYFKKLLKGGFNRISIGMQSADNAQLKILGRIHSFEDTRECVKNCFDAGFKDISIDLMFGIPNQDLKSFEYSMDKAIELMPTHLSCYCLKIENDTPFAKMKLNIADDDLNRDMYDRCVEKLSDYGYKRYEISNFARNGYVSKHNCKYWMCDDFIGFGAGAYSCISNKRFSNELNVYQYIDRIAKGNNAVCSSVDLSNEDKMSEFVYLGLRMDDGIDVNEFKNRFCIDIEDVYKEEIQKNLRRGIIMKSDNRLYIPKKYTYVCNGILSDFV